MTPRSAHIPLTYYGHPVGSAVVDESLRDHIPQSIVWGIELPGSLRQRHVGRPDVLLAMLIDEPTTLDLCHPFAQVAGLVIRLNRLALRPHVADQLTYLLDPRRRESAVAIVRSTLASVSRRVTFVNRSRVDCRLSNLREVQLPEDGLSLDSIVGDAHPPSTPNSRHPDLKEFLL